MNLIINPQFESLCPPLNEERDAACDEVQEARAEADHAKADQVRMAGMWPPCSRPAGVAENTPSCTPPGRGSRRNWSRRGRPGGIAGFDGKSYSGVSV